MKRTDNDKTSTDRETETANQLNSQNDGVEKKHRHMPRVAHVVTSIACAVGSIFIPHFLQHKPSLAPTQEPEQVSLLSGNKDSLLLQNLSSAEPNLPIQQSSAPEACGKQSFQNSLLPVVAPTVAPTVAPPTAMAVPREADSTASVGGAASFAVGNRLSSTAKIFGERSSHSRQSAIISVDKVNRRITIGQTLIKCSADSKVYLSKAGTICLQHGDTLVDAKNPLLVRVGTDFILVRKDATALISVREGTLKVRNLQEQHAFSTELAINNRPFTICAGEELVAANDFESLQSTLGSDGVTRRQVQTYELNDGTNVMRGEFAPVTVMKHNEMLKAMSTSTDRTDSKLFNKMMKMAACIAVVTGSHGSYAPVTSEPVSQQMAYSAK